METKTVKVGPIEFHLRYPQSYPQPKPAKIKDVQEEGLDEVEQEEEAEKKRKTEEIHPEEADKTTCL